MDSFIGSPPFYDELWRLTSVILALGRWVQEDWLHVSSRPAYATQDPVKLDLGQVSSLRFEFLVVLLSCWFKCFFLNELVCLPSDTTCNLKLLKMQWRILKSNIYYLFVSVCAPGHVYWSQSPSCSNPLFTWRAVINELGSLRNSFQFLKNIFFPTLPSN